MTSINLTRHDARLGGDSRLRLAKHLQIINAWNYDEILTQLI